MEFIHLASVHHEIVSYLSLKDGFLLSLCSKDLVAKFTCDTILWKSFLQRDWSFALSNARMNKMLEEEKGSYFQVYRHMEGAKRNWRNYDGTQLPTPVILSETNTKWGVPMHPAGDFLPRVTRIQKYGIVEKFVVDAVDYVNNKVNVSWDIREMVKDKDYNRIGPLASTERFVTIRLSKWTEPDVYGASRPIGNSVMIIFDASHPENPPVQIDTLNECLASIRHSTVWTIFYNPENNQHCSIKGISAMNGQTTQTHSIQFPLNEISFDPSTCISDSHFVYYVESQKTIFMVEIQRMKLVAKFESFANLNNPSITLDSGVLLLSHMKRVEAWKIGRRIPEFANGLIPIFDPDFNFYFNGMGIKWATICGNDSIVMSRSGEITYYKDIFTALYGKVPEKIKIANDTNNEMNGKYIKEYSMIIANSVFGMSAWSIPDGKSFSFKANSDIVSLQAFGGTHSFVDGPYLVMLVPNSIYFWDLFKLSK